MELQTKPIQTVAVLGAGAVGSYFIWGLLPRLGENLWVIADGSRAERLKQNGILVNGECLRPAIRTPQQAHGADLLLVTVKYGALEQSLDDIAEVVDEHTIVISLLNGVDSEEIIGARIGAQHMIYSVMRIASERRANGVFFNPDVTLGMIYGEPGEEKDTPRMRALIELFDSTVLHHLPSQRIGYELWKKFCFNVSMNLPQAVLGAGVGCYGDSAHVAAISTGLEREIKALAAAKGIDISDVRGCTARTYPNKAARYSTLQDLDASRHTEIDMFSGAVVRMGKLLGVPTPYNEVVFHLVKAMEEKNDGLFDY